MQCISWKSLYFAHPNLVQNVTATSHPPPGYILSPRYEKSVTVSTSSFIFFPDLLHFCDTHRISYIQNLLQEYLSSF